MSVAKMQRAPAIGRRTVKLALEFTKGYVADPYWPARDQLINIQKQSGLNRAKSDASRRKALEEHLKGIGMSLDEYRKLEKVSNETFYRRPDGEIIIPEIHITSFMVATCDEARSATRPCEPGQVRSRFTFSDFTTGKKACDGVWERFALVQSGTQKLSNQRGLRRSEYICDFEAHGTVSFDPDFVEAKILQRAIEWGGQQVGVGASRKMGWGRFTLLAFD